MQNIEISRGRTSARFWPQKQGPQHMYKNVEALARSCCSCLVGLLQTMMPLWQQARRRAASEQFATNVPQAEHCQVCQRQWHQGSVWQSWKALGWRLRRSHSSSDQTFSRNSFSGRCQNGIPRKDLAERGSSRKLPRSIVQSLLSRNAAETLILLACVARCKEASASRH